ncbi:hypothetical protein MMC16_006410 [Acarospora aff. strigata]|nr:hypothetical protein [Acarospora aff. strigata]
MNRFRTKKKARDAADAAGRSLSDPDGTSFPSFSSKSIRKTKKVQPEPKQELDLSTALPSSDDFRTSLLMPNLSARFSMLREQDDPTSKIGKANDDSVLFPKRASRLNLFSHNGLSDIAESAPLDSIRPPFAYERADSYHSSEGYGTDDDSSHSGSVMGRPKHREGNNLFGGRQKIYKIPVGGSTLAKNLGSASVSADDSSSGRMVGRALYGDDVSTASFQKLWEREREELGQAARSELVREDDDYTRTDDCPASPALAGYNKSRETSSSTASGPSNIRTSTAATSIGSQSVSSLPGAYGGSNAASSPLVAPQLPSSPVAPERSATRSRRLYGQGLDQHMHEQQNSALHKLESLQQRVPAGTTSPPNLLQSQSAFDLRDHYHRAGSPYALPGTRAVSPPPPPIPCALAGHGAINEDDGSLDANGASGDGFAPPLSPTMSDDDSGSIFTSAVQPNDRGKATALGTFNKPSMPFDEQQYSQRQFQLQQARAVTPPDPARSPEASGIEEQVIGRSRDGSDASSQDISELAGCRSEASTSESTTTGVPAMRSASEESSSLETEPTRNQTFFAPSSDSDERSETESEPGSLSRSETAEDESTFQFIDSQPRKSSTQSEVYTSHQSEAGMDANSACAAQSPQRFYMDFTNDSTSERASTGRGIRARNDSISTTGLADINNADSPTLGPTSGLSGLVRAHLRNDSGQSSIYAAPSPGPALRPSAGRSSSEPVPHSSLPAETSEDNRSHALGLHHWDDNTSRRPDLMPEQPEVVIAPPLSLRAKQILDQAAALRDHERLRAQQAMSEDKASHEQGYEAQHSEQGGSWSANMASGHQRTESTETEKERRDFATELSNRRRRVQENLKNFAEEDSRSTSPLPDRQAAGHSPSKYPHAFGPMKSRPSKGSFAGRQDPSFKAMKMLGISGGGISNGPAQPQRDHRKDEEERMLRSAVSGSNGRSTPSSGQRPYPNGMHVMQGMRQRQASDEGYDRQTRSGPSPPSMSSRRDPPSLSSTGDRSRSRNGRYRDDVRIANAALAPHTRDAPYSGATRAQHGSIPQRRSPNAVDDREIRTKSPSAITCSVNNNAPAESSSGRQSPPSVWTDTQSNVFSPKPSPLTSYTSNGRPVIDDNSPTSPVTMASGIVSPQGFHSSGRIPNSRKKSVNKSDISEPTFLSGTSSVNTTKLPAGERSGSRTEATGRGPAPPLPPINPRRKAAQHTIANVFGRSDRTTNHPMSSMGSPVTDGHGGIMNRDGEPRPHVRQRLRKSSSEGGNLGERARHHALQSPPPAMPETGRSNAGMF